MSIIHEALKKSNKQSGDLPRYAYTGNIQKAADKKQRFNWGPFFILLVLVLITGPIVAPVFSSPFKRAEETQLAQSPASETSPNLKAQFGIEEIMLQNQAASAISKTAMPSFQLSGIVFSPDDAYCIINGQVLKAGDSLQGARLARISEDEVEVIYRDQKILLAL